MTLTIALAGKGGTGKTTVAAGQVFRAKEFRPLSVGGRYHILKPCATADRC